MVIQGTDKDKFLKFLSSPMDLGKRHLVDGLYRKDGNDSVAIYGDKLAESEEEILIDVAKGRYYFV